LTHRILVDANVILDVAVERDPHQEASQKILSSVETKKIQGFVSAASFPTLYYLLRREIGSDDAREYLMVISELLSIVAVDKAVLGRAMVSDLDDYEDAIQMASAEACRADFIVTRDAKGYKRSAIKAITPSTYLATFVGSHR